MGRPEQRRYERLATRQDASVRAAGVALRGEIRDYCRAGLYLAFERPLAAAEIRALPPSTAVLVEFADGRRTHRVMAQVARAMPTGLGLQVAALSDEVMAMLRAAGGATGAPAADAGDGLGAEVRRDLQQACHREFGTAMNGVLKAFFDNVTQALIDAPDDVVGGATRARFASAAREFASGRATIAERFGTTLREALRDPSARRAVERDTPDAPTELSLVGDEQFEEWLSLSTVVHQLESDLSLPLADLQRRYGALRGVALDRATNPFGPAAICRAFQEAIAPLDHPVPVRTVAFRAFGAELRARCPGLYATLNASLAPLDGSASAPRKPERKASPPPAHDAAGRDPDAARGAAMPGPDPMGPGPGAPGAGPPESGGAPLGDPERAAPMPAGIAELLESLQGLYRPMQAASAPASVDYSLERLMKSLSRAGAPRPGPDAARAAIGVGSEPSWTAPGPSSAPSGAPGTRPAALRAAIDRLARAGTAATVGADAPAADAGAAVRVLDALAAAPATAADGTPAPSLSARLAGALETTPLPAAYRRSVESATGLLGRALVESGVDSEVQWLLRRLERPLLKLALRDTGALESPEHPARRMVDLLEQYAIATDEQGRFFDDGLRRYLHQLVEHVAARGEDDPALFGRARDVLARLLAPIRDTRRLRVARLQEACEARDRIRQARLRVADALAARLGGRDVPEPVLRLLDAGWRQHLVLLEMRGAGADLDDGLAVVDRLLAWLGPHADPGPAFRRDRTALLNAIVPALADVCVDPALREACADDLERALAAVERGEGPPETVFHPRPDRAGRDVAPALRAWAQRLRIGEWWRVPREGRVLPMQLIWASRPDGAVAFASRSASDRHEMSLAEFARQVEDGRIRSWSDQDRPLLERSEFALLDEGRQALLERALQDPVSGLPNRKGFVQRLERLARAAAAEARAEDGDAPAVTHAVGIVEFDSLRMVWSACGVDAGEALVRELADAASECLGQGAVLASLRDDTFALLVPGVDAAAASTGPVETLRARLADHRFDHGGQRFSIGVSVGLAHWIPGEIDAEESLRRADAACMAARAEGRNRLRVYEQGSRELRHQETLSEWAGRLDALLDGAGLYLRAQQVRSIADASARPHYEILLGIEPQPGMETGTMGFVTAVERLGRSHDLDRWVIGAVFDWIEANPERFERIGGFAINVSPLSLGSPTVLGLLDERLARPGIPADKITFELTETAAMDSYGVVQDFIQRVRRHGCRVSLDDFGSGYASYSHLKNLRTDSLKIDGAFVRDLLDSPSDHAMVRSMHDVARSLGIRTVAEYVESDEILQALREIGIDYAQGYAIHKPCRIDEIDVG